MKIDAEVKDKERENENEPLADCVIRWIKRAWDDDVPSKHDSPQSIVYGR